MQRFFDFKGNPFYIQPANLNFNYLDHLSLTISIRRQQKETPSSCMLHFDSKNVSHLILLLLVARSKLTLNQSKAIVVCMKMKFTSMIKPLIEKSVISGVTFNILAFQKIIIIT